MKERFQKLKTRGVPLRAIEAALLVLAAVAAVALLVSVGEAPALAGQGGAALDALLARQRVLTVLLLAVAVLAVLSAAVLVLRPLGRCIPRIRAHAALPPQGARELRDLAAAYNALYDENKTSSDRLRYAAEHDPLTGLYNRGAFEKLRDAHEDEPIALLLMDVDKFKEVNDGYGHDVGDKILKKAADLLAHGFRSRDYPCRVGGDEFAVIMTDMDIELEDVLMEKLFQLQDALRDDTDGLPSATMSIGVAFSQQVEGEGRGTKLFRCADAALYRVKAHGRDGCAVYDPLLDD